MSAVEENVLHRPVLFRDGALAGTSVWANTSLRDHDAMNQKEEK
jgi:hypothetical protein